MSLPDRDPRFLLGRETHVADLDRLDADAAQNEFAVEGFAGADIDDLAVAGECGDGIGGRAERADVVIRKWRRLRHNRRGRSERHWWRCRRRWLNDHARLRWWRRGRRLLVREEIPLA